ncbi:MAG TPA: S24 family peptidase, partial [Thiobacillaceae bacterium]|nr:S24 family peptidase [Thiobacillaceae bacterium]
ALLIADPPATFMVRVTGDSMVGAGIASGDILVVDRGLTPAHGWSVPLPVGTNLRWIIPTKE